MSLDVYLTATRKTTVYDANITHNLADMAEKAGLYESLWRPEENGFITAESLIEPLEKGLKKLKTDPNFFRRFDSPNGWGLYEDFVPFVERYLAACKENPDATVEVSR